MKTLIAWEKIKKHQNILGIVIGAIAICVFSAYWNNQFSYDDGYLSERFSSMINEYGVLETIIKEFLNEDLASIGEMRFYGLSKVIHVMIYLLARDNVWVYQFIITGSHFCVGGLLYKILEYYHFDRSTKFMCVCAWWFSPFAHIQTFHHFSYLFLPLYFAMEYLYFNLKNYAQTERKYLNILLIFFCVFTGEAIIPLMGLIMLAFIISGIVTKKKHIIKRYILHLFIAIAYMLSYFLLWNYKICEVEDGRFSTFVFSTSKLSLIKRNFVENFKYFLWLDGYKYGGYWRSSFSFYYVSFILICSILVMYKYYKYIKQTMTDSSPKLSICKSFVGAVIGFVGITVIYFLLNVLKGYEMAERYFFTIFTVLLCIIVVFINYIPNRIIKNGMNGILIFILLVLNVFWNGILIPEYGKRNFEIAKSLEMIKDEYNSIVVITENPVYGKVLEKGNYYRPKSAFSEAWATESYLNDYFDDIVFVPEDVSISYVDDKVYLHGDMMIYKHKEEKELAVEKNNTCFMYLDYKNDWKISSFNEFFLQWQSQIFSWKEEFVDNLDLIFCKQVLTLMAQDESIINGDTVISVEGGNVSELETGNMYFNSNRNSYGTKEFVYNFYSIPTNSNIKLFMDFNDVISHNPGDRIFDIEISFDEEVFFIKDFDIYDLGGNKPVRCVINLPNETKNMSVKFLGKKGVDVAMVQAVGLIRE